MNVAKQKSEYRIRKCSTIPWQFEKGSQRERTGVKTKPSGSQRGAKRIAKWFQKGARIKKHLQTHASRKRSEQVGENDAKRMTMYIKKVANMEPKSMPKQNKF